MQNLTGSAILIPESGDRRMIDSGDDALLKAVDAAIMDCSDESQGQHLIVPVRLAAQAVAATAGASAAEFPQILQLVCERSIRRGHVLAFSAPDAPSPA